MRPGRRCSAAPPEACADGGTRAATFDDRDGNSRLPLVGNRLAMATVRPLVPGGGAYASAGQLRVIDNVGGNLVITAIDGTTVDLRLNVKSDDTSENEVVVALVDAAAVLRPLPRPREAPMRVARIGFPHDGVRQFMSMRPYSPCCSLPGPAV